MAITASTLWEQALEDLRGRLDEESFSTWLMPIHFIGHEDNVAILSVPSVFYRNWLANNYHEVIQDSLSGILHREVRVAYRIRNNEEPGSQPENPQLSQTEQTAMEVFRRTQGHSQSSTRPAELICSPLNRNYSFENFVVGECNRFAHAAALAVADPHSHVYNPLFLYGGVGLGKTHLMQAIGQRLQTFGQHLKILYISSEAFMNAFIESVAQKRMVEFRNCFRKVDLLMVDDVQFFSGAEQTQTEFFHTFNVLYDAGKKIILSSDHPPKELHELEERLRSRFEWGLIVDMQEPDLETRVAILRKKTETMGLRLSTEVSIYIAERVRSNLRKLEGALTQLAAHARINAAPITVDVARSLLGPFLVGEEPRKTSIEKIQMTVCNYFDLTLQDLTGPNRSRKFAMPRQIACYLCRELTQCSFPEIARKFGGRDHSSIIHSYRKIQQDANSQLSLQNLLKYLTKLIKEEHSAR